MKAETENTQTRQVTHHYIFFIHELDLGNAAKFSMLECVLGRNNRFVLRLYNYFFS